MSLAFAYRPATPLVGVREPWWPVVLVFVFQVVGTSFPPALVSGIHYYFLVLALIVWIGSRQKLPSSLNWTLVAFFTLAFIGLASGIGNGASSRDYVKDIWYTLNGVAVLATGYALYRGTPNLARMTGALLFASTVSSLLQFRYFIMDPTLLTQASTEIRDVIGVQGSGAGTALALILLWTIGFKQLFRLPTWVIALCGVICAASVIASFSRTGLISLCLVYAACFGWFRRREWLKVLLLAAAGLIFIAALRTVVDTRSAESHKSFLGKLARSFDELKVRDYRTQNEIDTNWRGYETARALQTYQSGEPRQWVFGQGFGATVDLKYFQMLSKDWRAATRYIPLFHNGYMYLLIKMGIVGLAIYLTWLIYVYRLGRGAAQGPERTATQACGRLLQGQTLALTVTTFIVSGPFNRMGAYGTLLVIGIMLAVVEPRSPAGAIKPVKG